MAPAACENYYRFMCVLILSSLQWRVDNFEMLICLREIVAALRACRNSAARGNCHFYVRVESADVNVIWGMCLSALRQPVCVVTAQAANRNVHGSSSVWKVPPLHVRFEIVAALGAC